MSGTDLALTHVTVLIGDHDEALAFYRDVIGLEVRTDIPLGGIRWLTVGPASQPTLELVLEVPEMHPDPQTVKAMRARVDDGMMSLTLIFGVDDCDATFERIVAAGATPGQEPLDQPYGVRDCSVSDPWGNQLRFSQPLA